MLRYMQSSLIHTCTHTRAHHKHKRNERNKRGKNAQHFSLRESRQDGQREKNYKMCIEKAWTINPYVCVAAIEYVARTIPILHLFVELLQQTIATIIPTTQERTEEERNPDKRNRTNGTRDKKRSARECYRLEQCMRDRNRQIWYYIPDCSNARPKCNLVGTERSRSQHMTLRLNGLLKRYCSHYNYG